MSGPPPIRLKVGYKTPENLLGELTKSVGRGGVRVETKKSLPIGTQFVFELHTAGMKTIVEVMGTVIATSRISDTKHSVDIRYEPPTSRVGIDALLERIFAAVATDKKRKFARIPLAVRAVEGRTGAPRYRLRDLSMAGVGIDLETPNIPEWIRVGELALVQMKLKSGALNLHGEISWTVASNDPLVRSRIGVQFGALKPDAKRQLEELLTLKVLPSPPWIVRLAFGNEALKLINAP